MNRSAFTKSVGIPLVFLLTFTLFYPLVISSSVSLLNKASYPNPMGYKATGPVVPQPGSAEYLVISPNDAWVQNFVAWKNLKGVPTQVANITWISSTFGGTDLAEDIWLFINSVYTSTSGTLKWVLLIGDNSTLPSRYVYLPDPTTEWTGLSTTLKPTDFYYSVMGDGNWDDDGDGVWGECTTFNIGGTIVTDEIGDWQPDVYVGRIPFSDQGNITTILSRTITYSRNPTSFSSTGWDSFLLAGAISNYDEEVWGWRDGDYTDEAELSDYLDANIIPSYYRINRFYENRIHFWNYSSPNTFQDLNNTAVHQGLNAFSPALVNLAAHGSPVDMQRKYDIFRPYGEWFSQFAQGNNLNVSGIAIGDGDFDGINEIVYTHDSRRFSAIGNGTVWIIDDLTMWAGPSLVWDLWNVPPPPILPQTCWPTCVDIGDVWNNGTSAIAVGTNTGHVIIFTWVSWSPTPHWSAVVIGPIELNVPILCIEVGNADNALEPAPYAGSMVIAFNVDIAWGHRNGVVAIATCFGAIGAVSGPIFVSPIANVGQAVYSIDVGNPNDDSWGEITIGTGYAGMSGPDGDSYMFQYIPPGPAWVTFTIDTAIGAIVYGLDTGDAGNDGFNKIVVGLGNGAIHMYEANKFIAGVESGTQRTIVSGGGPTGYVRCLRVGYVDDNDVLATAQVEKVSIIAGNRWGGIRKYHADNTTGPVDYVVLQRETLFSGGPMVSAIDVGELSYNTGETTLNIEIAAGTEPHLGWAAVIWYEVPFAHWSNMINAAQAGNTTATIPHLVYADSCLTGAYDYPQESLSDMFLQNMAIGYIGSMRVCWYYRGLMSTSFAWGLGRWMSQDYWDIFFSGSSSYRSGATLYDSKANYVTTFQGTHSQATWQTYHRKNLLSYALFGDPEVDIFTNNPKTMTVTYPTNANYNGNTEFRVMEGATPVSGATICLWDQDGSYYEVQTTNSSGYASFYVTATVPNTLNVTVTAHDYSPYESTIGVNHWIDISRPTISFNAIALTLDITGVTATCSNGAHGAISGTDALTYTYTIYDNSSDTATTLTGNMDWTGTEWQMIGLDVSSLSLGAYYVRCTFADSDVTDTTSLRSAVFSISQATPPPFDFFRWLFDNWLFIVIAIVFLFMVCIIILLLRRRRSEEKTPE